MLPAHVAAIKRGQALVMILTWSAAAQVDTDYTVFVHLVDSTGKVIAEQDGQPQRGKMPTSAWKPGQKIVDAIVLPIGAEAPLGDNDRVELGIYSGATMQRVSLIDQNGRRGDDKIVIEQFSIVP